MTGFQVNFRGAKFIFLRGAKFSRLFVVMTYILHIRNTEWQSLCTPQLLNVSFVGKGIQIINVYLILSSLPSYDFACMLSHMWQPNTCIMPMSIMVYLRIHRRVLSAFALSKTLCFSFFQELTPETFVWIEPETSILQCKSCEILQGGGISQT